MNYYPYMNMMSIPYATASIPKASLFSNLFKGINFSSILNGTGKVLNIANQTIPLIKQAKPVINNAKTMFHVMNEFKKVDNANISTNIPKKTIITQPNTNTGVANNNSTNLTNQTNSLPTFFQ